MNILIIGGTIFLGRHLTEAALAAGHTVTLFNRGQHNPDLFPEVERIQGDRTTDLEKLQGRTWDAVIDTCGYVPRIVRASAEALAPATSHYTFISSISVYANMQTPNMTEDAAVGTLDDPTIEEVTGESYGPLKALCEQAVQEIFPEGALIIRPGLIVGPHDPTDRYTYWPARMHAGGEALVPDAPTQPVQVIDVRDLAEWTIRLVEQQTTGAFHVSGPKQPLLFGPLIEQMQQLAGGHTNLVPVAESFLREHEVGPWMEVPLWLGNSESKEEWGLMQINPGRAEAAGLTFRSSEETIRATLRWLSERPADQPWRAGLTPEREQELLAAWHKQQAAAE